MAGFLLLALHTQGRAGLAQLAAGTVGQLLAAGGHTPSKAPKPPQKASC